MFEYLLYYPVTFILWVWHKVFGFAFGEANAASWVLGIVFLTFTIRAILFKPFVSQVRSMKKMQDFAPEIKKIQKRYANDKQRQAQAMQKLQREHGVNPLGGCLPILLQVPVFIGLNHTLRAFAYHHAEHPEWGNYFFDRTGVEQYMGADLFGSHLGEAIYNTGLTGASAAETAFHATAIPVAVPLMILASVLTHLTARHSVDRQNPASATQQTAMMNKLTLYIFPIGLLVFGAFLPLGLLIYFLSNNAWTLMQQRVVYTRIDREEEAKKVEQTEKRSTLAPKPGQRPSQQKKRPSSTTSQNTGAKSASDKTASDKTASDKTASDKTASDKTASDKSSSSKNASSKSTTAKGTAAKGTAAKKSGDSKTKSTSKTSGQSSSGGKTAQGKPSGNSSGKSSKKSSSKSSSATPQNGSGDTSSVSGTAEKDPDRKRR